MRLYVLVFGSAAGMVLSGFLTSMMMPTHDENTAFPVPAESTRLMHTSTRDDSRTSSLYAFNKTDNVPSHCPPWKPEQQKQVLLVAFHPEKTAGSTTARFFELQEKVNGGNFEMMSPWNETWLLQWLGDPDYRALHPRAFVHLHGKGSFYNKRAFRRQRVLEAAKLLPQETQDVLQADTVDPTATGFFEYLVKLLAMHAPRLEKQGARVLAVPSWREPGDHFVSGLMFLDFTHKRFRNNNRLGVMGHARRALNSLVADEQAKFEYYKPEVLLLYYYGLRSPLVAALHNVTQVGTTVVQLSHNTTRENHSARNEESRMSFMEAYNHIHNFVIETMNVTLWAVTEKLDQSLLLIAQEAGFRLYEEETCLPLWDTKGQNVNPQRKRGLQSTDESIVAGIGRTVMSPGASIVHPLLLQAHDAWWSPAASKLDVHLAAIKQARNRFSNGVSDAIQEKRKKYKVFLQNEKFPPPARNAKKDLK